MTDNRPVAATDSVAVVEEQAAQVGAATAPVPTWRRANRREIAAWAGVGASAVLIVEVIAVLAIGLRLIA